MLNELTQLSVTDNVISTSNPSDRETMIDGDVIDLIRNFSEDRKREIQQKMGVVCTFGYVMCAIGLCLAGLCVVLFNLVGDISLSAYRLGASFSLCVCVFGVLTFTSVNYEDYDFDELANASCTIRFFLFLAVILFCTLSASIPPYVGFISVLIALPLVIRTNVVNRRIKFSALFVVNLFLMPWGFFPWLFRAAIYTKYIDLDSGVLLSNNYFGEILNDDRIIPAWWVAGGVCLLWAISGPYVWWHLCRHTITWKEDRPISLHSEGVMVACYIWLVGCGTTLVVMGVGIHLTVGRPLALIMSFNLGLVYLVPYTVLRIIGREHVFQYVARVLDTHHNRIQRDGAFIAELLDRDYVSVGQNYWLRKDVDDERYDERDQRRFWRIGHVSNVNIDSFTVVSPAEDRSDDKIEDINVAASKYTDEDLKEYTQNMRCIEWTSITEELLTKSPREITTDEERRATYSMSRAIRKGELIDFFISHSWNDDGKKKYEELSKFANAFRSTHARYPTFWLDKVCIDQGNMALGLRSLAINVTACRKMLLFMGSTYVTRLWCIWELSTLFAFSKHYGSTNRIEYIFMADEKKIITDLANFNLAASKCWDPNEEYKLKRIISGVGRREFEEKIQAEGQRKLNAMNSKLKPLKRDSSNLSGDWLTQLV